jgi:uncharacterized damage-inducible protein DinB
MNMLIRDALLPEFDHESANTRKVLERMPEDQFGWQPHPKSWTAAQLCTHLATMLTWGKVTIEQDSFDVSPDGKPYTPPPVIQSREELLAKFDEGVAGFRAALAQADNERLMAPWSLLSTGKPIFTMPRAAVLRSMILNHIVHHRGQLTIYLRMTGAPVPALYGPSADEGQM